MSSAKPYVIKERCAAQPQICPPLWDCPNKVFTYIEDDDEPVVDE